MKKNKIILPDGRYLIYYNFENSQKQGKETSHEPESTRVHPNPAQLRPANPAQVHPELVEGCGGNK